MGGPLANLAWRLFSLAAFYHISAIVLSQTLSSISKSKTPPHLLSVYEGAFKEVVFFSWIYINLILSQELFSGKTKNIYLYAKNGHKRKPPISPPDWYTQIMKCSSRHTLAPIDSIFGGQLPPILPPEVRLVEAHSLQSERRPTPSSLPKNVYSGPEWRPTPFSPSTVYCTSPWAVGFLCTPGVHGAWILTEHSVTHFPIFSHIKLLLSLF